MCYRKPDYSYLNTNVYFGGSASDARWRSRVVPFPGAVRLRSGPVLSLSCRFGTDANILKPPDPWRSVLSNRFSSWTGHIGYWPVAAREYCFQVETERSVPNRTLKKQIPRGRLMISEALCPRCFSSHLRLALRQQHRQANFLP